MEFLANSQALEFRKPLAPAKKLKKTLAAIRTRVPVIKADRAFHKDVEAIADLMRTGHLSTR